VRGGSRVREESSSLGEGGLQKSRGREIRSFSWGPRTAVHRRVLSVSKEERFQVYSLNVQRKVGHGTKGAGQMERRASNTKKVKAWRETPLRKEKVVKFVKSRIVRLAARAHEGFRGKGVEA